MGTHTPTYQPYEDLEMAEGFAEAAEGREDQQNHYRTTTEMHTVLPTKEFNPAAETGLVAMVVLDAEGKDDDEAQDASLTGEETLLSTDDVPAEMPRIAKSPLSDAPTVEEVTLVTMPTTQSITNSSKQKTVLIVEDNIELSEFLVATVERMNLKAVHETHGDKAVARFWELNPDILLLDIGLPDTTGWKIMDAIKERLETTNGTMPIVIIITAFDDPANRLIGKLQGVHSYLIKSFTADEIEAVITNALDNPSTTIS